MNRLLDIGFTQAGQWVLQEGKPTVVLQRFSGSRNVLYAFLSDGVIKYIGKTTMTLGRRMYGYRRPGSSQSTNIRVNGFIAELLAREEAVTILVLPDAGLLRYGGYHLNIADGLEGDLIDQLQPQWNAQGIRTTADDEVVEDAVVSEPKSQIITVFEVVLQQTYLERGFFNVPVAQTHQFGTDGEEIEILTGPAGSTFTGLINRTANKNGSPRIIGGTKLRAYFQAEHKLTDKVTVEVTSPISIRVI